MSRIGDRLEGLRWRLSVTRLLWKRGASDAILVRGPSVPSERARGLVDRPRPGSELERGPIDVHGWATIPGGGAIAQVEVKLGGLPLGEARIGVPRPDVAAANGLSGPDSGLTGFQLTADLTEWPGRDGEAVLEVIATGISGRRCELKPVKVEVRQPKPPKPPKIAPPAARTPRSGSESLPHVLVFTHQLNLGGAQLYLLDLMREMSAKRLAAFTLVSAMDGRLREDVEELGIPVHISSPVPVDDLSAHIGRVEEIAAWAEDRDFDAALVNTATSLTAPGAEAAQLIGLPVVWAIHESFRPSTLWADQTPLVRERSEVALKDASVLLFEAEATQRLFEPATGSEHCMTVPYGLDLEPIETARNRLDRAAARRKAGIPEDAELVVCIGTVEPRKAQLMLAQAFAQIAERHPRARLAVVGGSRNVDSVALEEYIESSPFGDRIELIPITPDVQTWYGIADLLVCASDIESLPRTVLEAMAWETPVLATEVFGLPELIDDGETGWLCKPRDLPALAAALDRVLAIAPEERQRVGEAGRELVLERHSLEHYGRRVAELLKSAESTNGKQPDRDVATS